MNDKCKICESDTSFLFQLLVLNKYKVNYFQCNKCDFIQTEEPYWLQESYSSAITGLDLGLCIRNVTNVYKVKNLINFCFHKEGKFVDYGGGYGMFVRLMRDNGFKFHWQDSYCDNIFAKGFEHESNYMPYELLTAFEVFEHLENPVSEIENMLKYSNSILFTTELIPTNQAIKEWWYMAPEIGQHIAFYSKKSLILICERLGLNLVSYKNIHLITNKKVGKPKFYLSVNSIFNHRISQIVSMLFRDKSLLGSDVEATKGRLFVL